MNRTKKIILCSMFTALVAVGAFIKIPIPVVPFSLQMMIALISGILIGGKLGALSVILYIVLGLSGVPIFTQGGGISYLLKPTFGYIIGFAGGAFVTGIYCEKKQPLTLLKMFFGCFIGVAVVYIIGLAYFYIISNYIINMPMPLGKLLISCWAMFIPTDMVQCLVACLVSLRLRPIIRKYL